MNSWNWCLKKIMNLRGSWILKSWNARTPCIRVDMVGTNHNKFLTNLYFWNSKCNSKNYFYMLIKIFITNLNLLKQKFPIFFCNSSPLLWQKRSRKQIWKKKSEKFLKKNSEKIFFCYFLFQNHEFARNSWNWCLKKIMNLRGSWIVKSWNARTPCIN